MLKELILSLSLAFFSITALAQQLNLNTANEQEIASAMNGVGPEKAKAIVDYRKKNGKFDNLDAVTQVKGIGAATIEKNRDKISVK